MDRTRRDAAWLRRAQQRGLMNALVWPVSLLYRSVIAVRRWLYASGVLQIERAGVPVIVVGNVVVGGAGKTPCTIALVQHLKASGWRPGVVSRGHGRHTQDVRSVDALASAHDVGDEPLLIQRSTGVPVFVAKRRAQAAHALLAAHPQVDVLVCDDGLQHLALGRDVSIVVFDDRGVGNGWMLPAGLLREPWPPGLNTPFRPDIALHQRRANTLDTPSAPVPGLPAFEGTRRLAAHAIGPHGQRIELSQLRQQPLDAVAGIARPEVFFDMLRERGLAPVREVPLPDHADTEAYASLLRDTSHTLICTEKDAVKLFPLLAAAPPGPRFQAWSVPLELTPEPAFFDAVDERLARVKRPRGAR